MFEVAEKTKNIEMQLEAIDYRVRIKGSQFAKCEPFLLICE